MIPKSVAQKYLDMKGKSNHYLEYKIKKDGIQPIENDRGMPSTRAEGLSVNENTTHAQLNKIITQKEKNKQIQSELFDQETKIEINETEKNIIRYCVEESYKISLEQKSFVRAEIAKNILDKLNKIKKKEEEAYIY